MLDNAKKPILYLNLGKPRQAPEKPFALSPDRESARASRPHADLAGEALREKAKEADKWALQIRWKFLNLHRAGDMVGARKFIAARKSEIKSGFWRSEKFKDIVSRMAEQFAATAK